MIANGDIRSRSDASRIAALTGVDGVMSARGILSNPAMFAGYDVTPRECVERWVQLSLGTGTPFPTFHHHLTYMCEKSFSRAERRAFNVLSSTSAVVDFLRDKYDLEF